MNYQAKRLLITGGCGFIGSNFLDYLSKTQPDAFLLNVDNLSFAADLNNVHTLAQHPNYQFIKADITNQSLMLDLLKSYEIDTIVHFAAESHVDRSISDPGIFVHSNLIGTYSLLEAARNYWLEQKNWNASQCLFYHISTDEVYGSLNASEAAFTETTRYAPNSPYSATKAGSDHLLRAYHHTYQLPTILSNCSNNYGPKQHNEKFIPTIIRTCLAYQAIPVYGDGSNIRDWLYVEDHCRAIHLLIESGLRGETYNIGGNQEKTNLEVVHTICRLLDEQNPHPKGSYQKLIHFVKDRPGHDWRYAINSKKLQQLGWMPNENFESGLEKTINHAIVLANDG